MAAVLQRQAWIVADAHDGSWFVVHERRSIIRCSGSAHITPLMLERDHLTMRWSERRTVVRSTFEMIFILRLRATRALVRRRSSNSR